MRAVCELGFETPKDAYNSQWLASGLLDNLARIEGDQSVEEIEALLRSKGKGLRILDVGCGMGRTVHYFGEHGFDVTGIDIAKEGLRIYKRHRTEARLVCGAAADLPFRRVFDVIMIMGVLYEVESVSRIEAMLRDLGAALKPGGHLLYVSQYPKDLWKTVLSYVPFGNRWFRTVFMPGAMNRRACFTRWVISNRETIDLFTRSGWRLERCKPLNHYYGAANWFYDLFYKRKSAGIPLAFEVEKQPGANVRWPGRLVARFSRRFMPMLCAGLVYFQFAHGVSGAEYAKGRGS